jgi:SAM-dependent methyltransferase
MKDHVHYEHYSAAMIRRLDGFFGDVDQQMNERIARHVVGSSVLDIGCGFGNLVESLRKRGLDAVGVDMLPDCVIAGKDRFPEADLRVSTSARLEFDDKSFDTLILKDTIHHIFGEGDIRAFLEEAKRVCRRRIIVFDPNPMAILLLARRLIGHVDPICAPADASGALRSAGFAVASAEYSDVVAFPLSGGYVGPVVVPGTAASLRRLILNVDRWLERVLLKLRIERHFCWRYMLVGDLP